MLQRLFERFSSASPWNDEQVLREEIFSIERLEQHAQTLAAAQPIASRGRRERSIAARLRDNEKVLLAAYRDIARAVDSGRPITPAAEWLLDNYHLVEEQIREIREDLPPGFYRQLPKLAAGPLAGYPRVLGLAWAFVAHNDSRFEPEVLRRFVRAYEKVEPLTIGELWAVAITLRVVLVENLRRAAQRIVASRVARERADAIADRLLGVNGREIDPRALLDEYDEGGPLTAAFAVQLVQRLRDQDPRVIPAVLWLEERLVRQGTNADQIVRDEHQRQGASNVTVRNIITSMRLMSDMDWAEFFESVSLVDDMLRAGSDFAAMDFATRNLYRSAIEHLARGTAISELTIAERALEAAAAGERERERDPGHHLIGDGRLAFERSIGYRPPLMNWLSHAGITVGAGDYIAAIVLIAALLLSVPLSLLHLHGFGNAWLLLLAALGAIPVIDVAVALVNRAVTRGLAATLLPGLALRNGLPEECRTLIAVPILLGTRAAIEEQIERLEIHYLSSPDDQLHFALLSDWKDAPAEHADGDEELLQAAALGVAMLNERHGAAAGGQRFLLLHRRRMWNHGEHCWMGWERKRGKLHELNRLLRGAIDTSFISRPGLGPVPPDVCYVLTLDADTRLTREAAHRLIGKMAHPLNRPVFDAASGRVTEGYAVLQPRVTFSLPVGRESSPFQRVFSGATGIDPYAAAVSDVYQDLLGEGSYAGKGIYDVDAFEAALAGRVPENSLLSHDLFEGIFARAGLASDIEVVEDFPVRYDVAALRQHRWVRGDWQLLPWLLGRRHAGGARTSSRLTVIGRWKMLDNLRRSLSAPASVAALLAGWLLPLNAALMWTCFVLVAVALPHVLPLAAAIVPRHAGITARSHLRALRIDIWMALSQIALLTVFLAHQAWLMGDAICRTLHRLYVSHRHLLEWMPAEQVQASAGGGLRRFYWRMRGSWLIAIAAVSFGLAGGATFWIAAPFVALWIAAPAFAWRVSRVPAPGRRTALAPADVASLRRIARRTWRYFETFVTAEDHMLPPDNFQEDPRAVVAHRTSPTNIGLYLLSAVAARDFGWNGTLDTVERIEATLATLRRLQKFRGHCFNWYDSRDLRPLEPQYVSSVDSGNLAAHLVALAGACREWQSAPAPPPEAFSGLSDALQLACAAFRDLPQHLGTQTIPRRQLETAFDDLQAALATVPVSSADFAQCLERAVSPAITLLDMVRALGGDAADADHADLLFWSEAIYRSIESWRRDFAADFAADGVIARLNAVANEARALADAMDFGFLLDPQRKLLSIGYRAADGTLDPSCYDLLASEARLASFFAIAKGDVPARHWFRLGRAVTPVGAGAALISWSGSMFEYLMPGLVLRAPSGSFLEQTSRLIVRRQVRYGEELGLPWGVSESAYNARDLELTYQYSNFGVPGLGLKRGLSENKVIAPYATALAAMVEPGTALRNYERLAAMGARGRYGFYEAIDFTPSRLPEDTEFALVRAYMAHHQGMSVVSIANALFDGRMRTRFHADPAVQATELLLQERTPRDISLAHPRAEEVTTAARITDTLVPEVRRLRTPHDDTPQTHLLSNGRYAVMMTAAGSGYSRWQEFAVTRWREDPTRDDTGTYIYLRDAASGAVWSAGYQPCAVEPDSYEATFTEERAEIIRHDHGLTTTLEITVSPEDDAEIRRLSITNTTGRTREIEVTSYVELALAPPAADAAHPAFSKLFVQTEYLPRLGALLATRRRRDTHETPIWVSHHAVIEAQVSGAAEVETDRAKFIGRGHALRAPLAVMDGRPLSNTTGTVLDAVFALRYRLRVPEGGTAHIAFWTAVAATRSQLVELLDKHRDPNARVRVATLAWTQAQVQLRHLGIDAAQANLFQRLAGKLLFADSTLRPSSDTIRAGAGGPPGLWSQGISGDLPIVLLRIAEPEDTVAVHQLLQAHEYWRMKRLWVDLVILNERGSSYVQDLQIAVETLVRTSQSRPGIGSDQRGAVFVLRTDLISTETRGLLSSVARIVLQARHGTLADQLERLRKTAPSEPRRIAADIVRQESAAGGRPAGDELEFFNGLGGFARQGREYVIAPQAGQTTPAPWINVIANAGFGFHVAAEGSGYTWAANSRENTLTPWSNDPVSDRPGEVFYLTDEASGELWCPTAAPIRESDAHYETRHGLGYSRFLQRSHDCEIELTLFVPVDDPVKICRLKLRNTAPRRRALAMTAYVEWVLGTTRAATAPYVITEMDGATGAMFARNPWNAPFGHCVAFADLGGRQSEWTADRREFLGRHGRMDAPAALLRPAVFSGRTGAGLDPCCALRTHFEVEPGAEIEIVFLLGQASDAAAARELVTRYRTASLDAVLGAVAAQWEELNGKVQVKTPERAFDIMLNHRLLYQTLACRTWARAAFYQASGAFGFRDQLQDAMAFSVTRPALLREQILRAAGRQFLAGDVQHWWLPHSGQGVRTRITDDRVWLAYVTAHYVAVTGDRAILDVPVPFLEGRVLDTREHDAFFQPTVTEETEPLFDHCVRGLAGSLAVGAHGLPLIGTGDWNDGMNRVGELGKGESVWLGWLLYATLNAMAPFAQARGARTLADQWRAHATTLRAALEEHGWDGEWYRRGFFDDGTPLGTATAAECRIDAIAQSWSVISGGADPARAARAMSALDEHLVRRDAQLAVLFTPPFALTEPDPGYIQAYPRGIRENGGQYTHAAIWSVIARAMQGDGDRAMELFSFLNPIQRSRTRADVQRYKVEPYAVAADVYSEPPHVGRGGWTWYTGSAGWLYRAGLEWILGFRVRGDRLAVTPCLPAHWPGYELVFLHGTTRYEIAVENPRTVEPSPTRWELDGAVLAADTVDIPLIDDRATHRLRIILGTAAEGRVPARA